MVPEIKAEWVKALRSGEYRQNKQFLHTSEGHCALGVLANIAFYVGVTGRTKRALVTNGKETQYYAYDGHTYELPDSVFEWACLPSNAACHIATANDRGIPFAEIAQWIEENL